MDDGYEDSLVDGQWWQIISGKPSNLAAKAKISLAGLDLDNTQSLENWI